jgi:hypothetical protein
MMGSLGIGANLTHWPDADLRFAAEMVSHYKRIRGTVQHGALYRLASPREGELAANEYISEDGKRVVLLAFLRSQQFGRPAPVVHLEGLDERGRTDRARAECRAAALPGYRCSFRTNTSTRTAATSGTMLAPAKIGPKE